MVKINEINEKDILINLFKSSAGLDAFTIFKKIKIPFSEFSKSLSSLTEKGFVKEYEEEFYKITTPGKLFLSSYVNEKKEKSWKEIPDRFRSYSIDVDSFYIPSLKLLDKKTFNLK